MNERIKQLAEQATTIVEMVSSYGYMSSYANFDREKFAELIVRECCDIVHRKTDESIRVVMAIEEHFGVEE